MHVKAKLVELAAPATETLNLVFEGVGKQFRGGANAEFKMGLSFFGPRAMVKDYVIGDSFDVGLSSMEAGDRFLGIEKGVEDVDPYQNGAERVIAAGDGGKAGRSAFKEAFLAALMIRLKDSEFRDWLRVQLEHEDSH
jgi:hypothetical protein